MTGSPLLADILEHKEGATNLLVVFADVVAYSKRSTICQQKVVKSFTYLFDRSLQVMADKYRTYLETNGHILVRDVIRIPTGDGAAVAFAFSGLHRIHFDFARQLLKSIYESNAISPCQVFGRQGWCNCHGNFLVRVGIAVGITTIYRDMNGNINAAGNALNLAARAMGQVDGQQVALTAPAYADLVDLAHDHRLSEDFTQYKDVIVKHGAVLDLYQYTPRDCRYINTEPPSGLR